MNLNGRNKTSKRDYEGWDYEKNPTHIFWPWGCSIGATNFDGSSFKREKNCSLTKSIYVGEKSCYTSHCGGFTHEQSSHGFKYNLM